jgi:predicted hotdog family 3-hydroxylacyl-ACP dehydratase
MNATPGDFLPRPESVVPHRHGALLLDEIVSASSLRLLARMTVRPGTAFSDAAGNLQAWTGPEAMAQAVAALAGCRSLREHGRPKGIGLLLGVRGYFCESAHFPVGTVLHIEAVCTSEDGDGHGVFDCAITQDGKVLAAGTLTAFQPNNPEILVGLAEPA